MSSQSKFLFLLVIISTTLAYSLYEKQKYESLIMATATPILKQLPEFEVERIFKGEKISSKEFLSKLTYVHIWGTWCAPCEAELPSFIQFAKKNKEKGVKYILLAVNDKKNDVLKFLKKFDQPFPDNIEIVLDLEGESLSKFGTMKVPETFVFNGEGTFVKKYVGPQEWNRQIYLEDLAQLLPN